jgi:molybdenum cofactor biosynthesis enzyme MoaA
VRQFSFTGGEPFIIKDLIRILDYALGFNPCLVLTNGTDALIKRMGQLEALRARPHPLSLRVSIDYPDAARHDAGRGADMFTTSFQALQMLRARGFRISIARQMEKTEDRASIDLAFRRLFRDFGLPEDLPIVAFPDFATPGSTRQVPDVTEDCMTRYQTESSRREFMCAYSKMVIKLDGRMRVYACTLVDDDPAYDQGGTLREALATRVMMRHHRCYSCFAYGASCSETRGH